MLGSLIDVNATGNMIFPGNKIIELNLDERLRWQLMQFVSAASQLLESFLRITNHDYNKIRINCWEAIDTT